MRRYSDILGSLLVREQLLLGWKIGFFIVCGALLFASLQLIEINSIATEVRGTVMNPAATKGPAEPVSYLIVKLDSGETVRVSAEGPLDFRPGQRAVLRQTTTNIFGYKKYKFARYLERANSE
jgi:hypothetical protein